MAGGSEAVGAFPFSGTRTYFQEKIELPFFNYYLKGKGPLNLPEAVVFETGTDQWRTYRPPGRRRAVREKRCSSDGGRLSFGPAPEYLEGRFRRVCQRSGQTRALYHEDHRPVLTGLFRRRPALRRLPAGCPCLQPESRWRKT